jgi:hypothetical protein
MDRLCNYCGKRFQARNASQHYCSKIICQRFRKKRWQKQKLVNDPDYRANQKQAQESWRKKHPGYWKDYRESHPLYVERNRRCQRHRNGLRGADRGKDAVKRRPLIAKMDATPPVKSGTYRLIPIETPMIAKMDAVVVELAVVSNA